MHRCLCACNLLVHVKRVSAGLDLLLTCVMWQGMHTRFLLAVYTARTQYSHGTAAYKTHHGSLYPGQ